MLETSTTTSPPSRKGGTQLLTPVDGIDTINDAAEGDAATIRPFFHVYDNNVNDFGTNVDDTAIYRRARRQRPADVGVCRLRMRAVLSETPDIRVVALDDTRRIPVDDSEGGRERRDGAPNDFDKSNNNTDFDEWNREVERCNRSHSGRSSTWRSG